MEQSLCVVNCLVDKCALSKTDGVCDELVCMKCAEFAYIVCVRVYYAQN